MRVSAGRRRAHPADALPHAHTRARLVMPVERVEVGMPDCEECDSATVERSMARRVSDSMLLHAAPPRCDDCATQNSPTHSRSLASINAGLSHTSRSPNNPRPKTARTLARRGRRNAAAHATRRCPRISRSSISLERCARVAATSKAAHANIDLSPAAAGEPQHIAARPASTFPARPPSTSPPRYIPTQRPLQGGRHRRLTLSCILQCLTRLLVLTRAPQLAH